METREFKVSSEKSESFLFKGRKEYLEAINGHPEEKIGLLIECLREKSLPMVSSEISGTETPSLNILEIGPGGGSTLDYLKQYVAERQKEMPEIRVFSLEYLPNPSKEEVRKLEHLKSVSALVLGMVQELPFRAESMSAINLSAVLHEVNSYFVYGEGFGSVDRALEEVSRVIAPDGILAYRDIYAPLEGVRRFEKHVYSSPSWVGFIKWFVPYLLTHGRKIYRDQEGEIALTQNNKRVDWQSIDIEQSLEICAPAGLLREIQRHYITLRDYLLKNKELGIEEIQEEWVDIERGIKAMTVLVEPENQTAQQVLEREKGCKKIGTNIYRISDSLIFDRIVDKHIAEIFFSEKKKINELLEGWLKREGGEYYIYYNIPEMIIATAEMSKKQSEGEYILMPRTPRDIIFFPRDYYQRYLESVLENPLREGKQAIRFWKTKSTSAEGFLNNLEKHFKELENTLDNKTQEVLDALRKTIKK